MYHDFFGIAENPFSITPDPRYIYMSSGHEEALAHLLYGVSEGGGFVLLTGEVGTGKTSICRCLLEQLPDASSVALILNPRLDEIELLASICDELGVAYPQGTQSLKVLVDRLNQHLLDLHAAGRHAVVIIDEAQDLSPRVLEQVRLLTNLETATRKLLQIILIGQPELNTLLRRDELRQVVQRITARYHLQPLGRADTQAYVQHRLAVGGLAQDLFTRRAIRAIYRRARGVPRLINSLCDRCLLGAYAQNRRTVDARLVRQAAREVFGRSAEPRRGAAAIFGWVAATAAVAGALLVLDPAHLGLLPRIADWQTTNVTLAPEDSETPSDAARERSDHGQPDTRPVEAAPEAAAGAEGPDLAEAPEAAEVAGAPEAPDLAEAPEAPEVADVPEAPEVADVADAPQEAVAGGPADAPAAIARPATEAEPRLAGNSAALPEATETRIAADGEPGEGAEPASMPANAAAGAPVEPGPEPAGDVAPAVPEGRESQPHVETAAAMTAKRDVALPGRETPIATAAPEAPTGTAAAGPGETEAAVPLPPAAEPSSSPSAAERQTEVEVAAPAVPPAEAAAEPEAVEGAPVKDALDGSDFQAAADTGLEQALAITDLFARASLATDRESALAALFGLWGLDEKRLGGPADCASSAGFGVKCLTERTRWETLIGFNRPLLLTLQDWRGRRASAVLASVQDNQATLLAGGQRIVADVAAVRAHWTGDYLLLWRPPPVYSGLLALGARGQEVAWLRARLSELDGEAGTEVSGIVFDAGLQDKVMAFQKSRGLKPDGMVGVRTLIHLNTATKAAGIPLLRPGAP